MLKSRTNQHQCLESVYSPHQAELCICHIFPLQLKMLRQLAVLWFVVSIATCMRSSSSSHQRKTSSYVTRADSELIIDNRDKSYASYTKLHPG